MVQAIAAEKKCYTCGLSKPIVEFHPVRRKGRLGTMAYCRPCHNKRSLAYYYTHTPKPIAPEVKERRRIETMNRYRSDATYRRKCFLGGIWTTFRLRENDFDRMLLECCGRCEICGDDFTNRSEPHIDHCHTTGRVRGLLCKYCNVILGFAEDRPEVLRAAGDYLGRK